MAGLNRGIRDGILFFAGLTGIGYETLAQKLDRPELLVLFAGMIGLPAFLRGDEKWGGQPSSGPQSIVPIGPPPVVTPQPQAVLPAPHPPARRPVKKATKIVKKAAPKKVPSKTTKAVKKTTKTAKKGGGKK